jgi:lipopolysaccharide/colanic/teichoic acid biosynthesis glycosyltransferase
MLKRTFDFITSCGLLLLFSPLLIGIAAIIKATSAGPVFFRGTRIGYRGRPFRIYKFRSMVLNADKLGAASAGDDDPRITRVGKFLRKYKLDELPQLINVVLGQMSLVGPRPEVKQFVDMYTPEERVILDVRPGITDWASIWNPDEGALLAGSNDPDRTYLEVIRPEKLRLQLEYVRRRSFFTDLQILFTTAKTLVLQRVPSLAVGSKEETKTNS